MTSCRLKKEKFFAKINNWQKEFSSKEFFSTQVMTFRLNLVIKMKKNYK